MPLLAGETLRIMNSWMQRALGAWFLAASLSASGQYVPQTAYRAVESDPAWVQLLYSETATPEAIRSAYEAFYAEHPFEKNRDTQFYKRWLRNVELPKPQVTEAYASAWASHQPRQNGAWEEMGPWHYDPEVAMEFQVQSPGACHVYTVEQAPSDHQVVWCGTATAGAWKSTDHGAHWSLMTRDLPLTSVYSVAIHPENPSRVWVGSGDGQLWRTEDGGDTWSVCGNAAFQSEDRWYRDVAFGQGPDGPVLFAATNNGLHRSDNGGATMTQVASGEYMELEFHPTNPDVCYTVQLLNQTTQFKRSTDGGLTFQSGAVGWPSIGTGDEQRRCEIAVTPADPDRVVVLASGETSEGGGLYGMYQSLDAGQTFEFNCCGDGPGGPWEAGVNPNILGWSEDGTGDGGQYYYDLALDVSPTDPDRQFAAGICVWRTENGGMDWSLNAHWVTWAGEFTAGRYTHADVHDVKFFTRADGTVDLWVASDGGVFYSADQGDHMEPRMYGIHGTDFWGWQAGWRGPEVMVGGTYHNGTMIRNGDLYHWGAENDTAGGWLAELAGDNFRGFVNPGDATRGYHDGGAFRYTSDRFDRIDGLPFDNSKNPNTGYWFGEYGNLEWDPACYNTMLSPVGSELWRSEDAGASWALVHDFGGEKIVSVKVSPRDRNRLYVSQQLNGSMWRIHRSSDGGATWESASPTTMENGNNNNRPIYLDVDGTNPDRLWCVLTGTQTGHKILQSDDAGETWQDWTTGTIASERVVSVAHQRGSNGGVYVGTTNAVYFRDATMDDWVLYNQGLPMINVCTFLQVDYCGGHIRAAGTRGVHQAPLFEPSSVLAGFMVDRTRLNLASPCVSKPIHASAVSVIRCEGATYEWTFEGGQVVDTNGPDAWVDYQEAGTFDVTLTVTDAEGASDTWTWSDLVEVVDEPVVPTEGFQEGFEGGQFPPEHWRLETNGHPWEQAYDLVETDNGVAQFPNYWVDTQGAYDLLVTPAFNPTGHTVVTFDVAHRKYADYVDGLEVWGRPGNDEAWTVLWSAYGEDLSVEGCYTWFWYDTGGTIEWANHAVELPSAWVSGAESCLELAFVNVGGYGNHIWLDNVNLDEASAVSSLATEVSGVQIFPNPNAGNCVVLVPERLIGSMFQVHDNLGRLVSQGQFHARRNDWSTAMPSGMYTLLVEGAQPVRWVVR